MVCVLELLGFSLFIIVGMVTTNPGLCPFYPRVSERDKSCYVESNCSIDSDCKDTQKCCENPCGITLCYDNITPDSLVKIEKCPVVRTVSGCSRTRTKFCYVNECDRCCSHETSCNPAPKLLTEARNCHTEICEKHTCPQQGSVCYVDETTNKPLCRCISSCNRTGRYVCASFNNIPRTFPNRCYMDKDACEMQKTYKEEHEGRCVPPTKKVVPVEKPTVKNPIRYRRIGSSIRVSCIGDRALVHLLWVQKRSDGKEVEVEGSFERDEGVYVLNGTNRRVVSLSIPRIGQGTFGIYACKQKYDNVVMEAELHVKPKDEVIFDRKNCRLPLSNGTCNGKFPNYYYDRSSNRCKGFNYTGCDGNENNFQTLNECRVKCGGIA